MVRGQTMGMERRALRVLVLVAAVGTLAGCAETSPRIASDPGPGEPHFGYNEDWIFKPELLTRAADSGADTVRYNLSWSAIESEPGEYDWEPFDELYDDALEQGMPPILILVNAPCWASGLPQECDPSLPRAPLPEHLGAWAAFAAEAAARYPEARGLEIWNEPNLARFWTGEPLNPERYAELLVSAYDAIKATDPGMPVISAGLLPAGETSGDKMGYAEFLERALAAGGAGHLDAAGVHPYPFFADDPVKRVGGVLNNVRGVLAAAGEGETPLWVTEVGISTTGPDPYSPDAQAEAIGGIYDFVAEQPDVPVLILHRFADVEGVVGAREAGWGITTVAGELKPAFCEIAKRRGAAGC